MLFVLICSLYCIYDCSAAGPGHQSSSAGESELWSFIRRHMAHPLYWLHLKLESVKSNSEVNQQMRSVYQGLFNIKNKTELTFIQNAEFVITAMLAASLCFLVLILINFTSYPISILFTLFLIITYRLQGAVWCFDNLMLLISLASLAPVYMVRNPASIVPYISTLVAVYFFYRVISRAVFGRGGPVRSSSASAPNSYFFNSGANGVPGDSYAASIEQRMATFEAQQQTIIAKLDALNTKLQQTANWRCPNCAI